MSPEKLGGPDSVTAPTFDTRSNVMRNCIRGNESTRNPSGEMLAHATRWRQRALTAGRAPTHFFQTSRDQKSQFRNVSSLCFAAARLAFRRVGTRTPLPFFSQNDGSRDRWGNVSQSNRRKRKTKQKPRRDKEYWYTRDGSLRLRELLPSCKRSQFRAGGPPWCCQSGSSDDREVPPLSTPPLHDDRFRQPAAPSGKSVGRSATRGSGAVTAFV